MVDFPFDIDGIKDLEKGLDRMAREHPRAFAAALWQNALDVQRLADPKTPKRTGHLRRSYVVDKPRMSGTDIEVKVGYSANYALWAHEIAKNYNDGDWKFLERAVDEAASDWESKLAKRTDRNIKSGAFMTPRAETGDDFDRGDFGE